MSTNSLHLSLFHFYSPAITWTVQQSLLFTSLKIVAFTPSNTTSIPWSTTSSLTTSVMDAFEAYREPSVKVEPRWAGREDIVDRMTVGDGYRVRRSPGKTPRDGFSISYMLEMGIMLPSYQVWNSPWLSLSMFSLSHYWRRFSLRVNHGRDYQVFKWLIFLMFTELPCLFFYLLASFIVYICFIYS